MKRVGFCLLMMLILPLSINALEIDLENVNEIKYINCTNEENIWLKVNGKDVRVSLLAYKKNSGSLDSQINKYICDSIKNAKKIRFEVESLDNDKYNRLPVWLYLDEKLLQNELINKGYGQVANVKATYKNIDTLCESQKKSITERLGIWGYDGIKEEVCNSGIDLSKPQKEESTKEVEEKKKDTKFYKYYISIFLGIIILLLCIRGRRCQKIRN